MCSRNILVGRSKIDFKIIRDREAKDNSQVFGLRVMGLFVKRGTH